MSVKTGRRTFLQPKTLASTLNASAAFSSKVQGETHEELIRAGRPAMACQFEVFFPASQRRKIQNVHLALDEIQQLEKQMSVFHQDSEISSINRLASQGPVVVEEQLFNLLCLAADLHERTNGSFDITSGPLSECWGFSMREGKVPTGQEIAHVRSLIGTKWMDLDRAECCAFFRQPELQLNLGSIGKGYALDRAAVVLKKGGLEQVLLHAGHSSLLAKRSPVAEAEGWKVSIRHPLHLDRDLAVLSLCDQAMSTSGAGEQYFRVEGKKYGHVIDPRSGYPADVNLSATALTSSGAEADALSTAFFVMHPEEIEKYCQVHPQVGALIVPKSAEGEPLECFSFGTTPEDLEVCL